MTYRSPPPPAANTRENPSKNHNYMTPLQNDPQQHQREAKHREFRVARGSEWSTDSESARPELSKSGLASNFGSHKCDFPSNSGGAPRRGHQREPVYRDPLSLAPLGENREFRAPRGGRRSPDAGSCRGNLADLNIVTHLVQNQAYDAFILPTTNDSAASPTHQGESLVPEGTGAIEFSRPPIEEVHS